MARASERPPASPAARTARWAAAAVGLVAVVAIGLRLRHAEPPAATRSGPVIGRATIVVYYDGKPIAGRWVVFHDARGNVMSQVQSRTDGKAFGDVVAGGMVTVAYGTSMRQLVTVLDVKPGDEVLIGEREDEGGAGETMATAKVKLPGAYPSAARYGVSLGVSTTDVADVTRPLPMPVMRRFLVDGKFRVLALAEGAGGEAVAFAFTWATLGKVDGGDAQVDLPTWSTDWHDTRLILSNPPDGVTKAIGELAILAGEDARFERGRQEMDVPDAGGETSLKFAVPRPLGTKASFKLELLYGGSGDRASLTRRAKELPADVRLDLRAVLLPRVSGANVETKDDRARPTVRWTLDGDTSKADVTLVQLAWPETREHVWTIVAPPTQRGPIAIPELPDVLRDWRPDGRPIRVAVGLVDASFYAGYDDVRKKGLQLLAEPPDEDDEMSLGTSITGDLVF